MSQKYVTQLVAVLVPVIVCEGCGAEGVATPTGVQPTVSTQDADAPRLKANAWQPPEGWEISMGWEKLCPACGPLWQKMKADFIASRRGAP